MMVDGLGKFSLWSKAQDCSIPKLIANGVVTAGIAMSSKVLRREKALGALGNVVGIANDERVKLSIIIFELPGECPDPSCDSSWDTINSNYFRGHW